MHHTYADKFRSLLSSATLFDLHAAEAWYNEAQAFANSLRPITGWNLEVAASVVSAFSPRVTWGHNKAKALQYAQGITPKGLRSHVAAADRCVADGFNGLRGLKTNAFARAIAGDTQAVVVDVWMCRAAGLGKDAPNKTEYRAIADAVREEHGTRDDAGSYLDHCPGEGGIKKYSAPLTQTPTPYGTILT